MTTSTAPAQVDDLTPEQWALLASILSLDVAPRFYPAMGVPVADPAAFQRILRGVIVDTRRENERAPAAAPSIASMLAERLPASEAAAFFPWAHGVFLGDHSDQPGWSAWDIVFLHWAHTHQADLAFLPESKRSAVVADYRREVWTDDMNELGNDALMRPLSDWDVEIFARRNFGPTWESGPYSIISSIARIERFKRVVTPFWPGLAPAEREQMYRSAQALIDTLGVWMPGPLPHLEELPGGPS